jgi:hypothetical protein
MSNILMDCLTFAVGLEVGDVVGVDVFSLVVVGRKLGGVAVGYAKTIWFIKTLERCV